MRYGNFKKAHHKTPFKQGGLTLIELLIAISIVSLVVFLGVEAFQKIAESNKEVDEYVYEESIRNIIRARLDCANTLAGRVANENIILRGKNNLPIAALGPSNSMLIGGGATQWSVTVPAWNSTSGALTIDVVPPGQLSRPLFKKVPVICK